MKLWNGKGAFWAASLLLPCVAVAQSPQAGATCTTAPTGLTGLDIERTVPLANLLTTLTPTAPPGVLAAIAGGAMEIREHLVYNATLGTITSTIFLVAPGSPTPTPTGTIVPQNTLDIATIQIGQIFTSCSPTPSVLIVGTVSNSLSTGPYGSFNGAPAAVSIGYTTDTPPKINNIAVVIAGSVLEYSASATGTVTFPAVTVGPPGTTGGVTVKVKFPNGTFAQPGATFQVNQSPLLLDATPSTGGAALTYIFSSTQPVAFVQSGTPGIVNIQFPGPGDYGITVKATDSSGNTSSLMFTLTYTGRPQ